MISDANEGVINVAVGIHDDDDVPEMNSNTLTEEAILQRNIESYIRRSSASSTSSERQTMHQLSPKDVPEHRLNNSVSPNTSTDSTVQDVNILSERIQCLEGEKIALMVDHNNLIKEFNKRMQSHLEEIRTLKEVNQSIEQELNELRDLCCFLDDDRRKCRKLAKEWQKFGRHTVATLKSEVQAYQERYNCLENRNTHLNQENSDLRELCIHLDQQRLINNEENGCTDPTLNYIICPDCSALRNVTVHNEALTKADDLTSLENKVQQLEKEKDMLHRLLMYGSKNRKERNKDKKRVSFTFPDDDSSSTASELDMFDFPPTNFELAGLTSLSINSPDASDAESIHSLNSSSSVPRLTSEISRSPTYNMQSAYAKFRDSNNSNYNPNPNSNYNPNIANSNFSTNPNSNFNNNSNTYSNANSNLPPYEESMKYLEISKGKNEIGAFVEKNLENQPASQTV